MPFHELKAIIEAADEAITQEDFDRLMDFYAEDATLVVRPGMNATGKDRIRQAFVAIADHFNHSLTVTQGDMAVIEGGGDTALVVMTTRLDAEMADGSPFHADRKATYVFRKDAGGRWRCVIDNSYGTDLPGLDGDAD